ncbi:MAG TPA: hypothetical protein VGG34_09270 [Opitutaceae bacterium]
MESKLSTYGRLALLLGCAAFSLAWAGCSHEQSDQMTDAVVSGERPIAMEGSGAFFKGKVTVKVTVSRGIGKGMKRKKGDKDFTFEKYAHNENKVTLGNPMPPVTIHIILTNSADHSMTVSVEDFASDLGDFVVDPETLTIDAGQTSEPTPMVSDLGVSSDTIPFKVTLRYGADRETKTFPVTDIIDQAPPAPAPAPAAK